MMMKQVAQVLLPLVLLLSPPAGRADAPLKSFGAEDLKRIEASRRGTPFVLVLWSLDCVYCKASLKFLSQEAARRKLEIVTLATDDPADPQVAAQLKHRLAQAGVRGEAWAFGDAPPEQLRHAVDPKWFGELPRSYWYGADGTRTGYSGVIDGKVLRRLLQR